MAFSRVVNPFCFSDPMNNELAAYFIGLLIADGTVIESNGRQQIQLAVTESDRIIVDELNSYLGGKYKIGIRTNRGPGSYSQTPLARLTFGCKTVLSDLHRFGVRPRKTEDAMLHNGLQFNRHTWRGVIDGDGCIYFVTRPNGVHPHIGLVGSLPLVEQFVSYVRTVCPLYRGTPHLDRGPRVPIYRAVVFGRQAKAIAWELYRDCKVALPRKLALASQAMV